MIVRQDKIYETSALFPNTNFDESHPDNYVVDETTPKGQALAERIKQYSPQMDFVIENGNLVDVVSTKTEADMLNQIKEKKIKELVAARDNQLYAGFTSNVTGTLLYFGFDSIDQAYLQEKALLMTIDPTVTSVDWKVNDGVNSFFATLTREQFFTVIKDGGLHKEGLIRELMQLEAMVMNCTDEASVNAIVW